MTKVAAAGTPEHPPIWCLLELRYDGTVSIIVKRGCSNHDLHELLTLLAAAEWPPDPADVESTRETPGENC